MTHWRWLRRALGYVLLALALGFLSQRLLQLRGSVVEQTVVPGLDAVMLSAALSLLWLLTMVAGWWWMLRFHAGTVTPAGPRGLFSAFMQSFISRYVPGKVWPAVVLCDRLADLVAPAPALRSYLLAQMHLTASAAVLAIGSLPLLLSQAQSLSTTAKIGLAAALAAALTWALAPRPLFAVAQRSLPLPARWRQHLVFEGSVSQWAVGFALFILVGVLQGGSLIPLWQAVAEADQQLNLSGMVSVICAYAAARIIGQGVAVIPAGIGVREGAFVFLASGLSPEAALVSALWLRLIATAMEFAVWLATAALDRRPAR